MFASVRNAIDELTSSYSEKEQELISAYLSKLVILWTGARKKLQKRIKAKS